MSWSSRRLVAHERQSQSINASKGTLCHKLDDTSNKFEIIQVQQWRHSYTEILRCMLKPQSKPKSSLSSLPSRCFQYWRSCSAYGRVTDAQDFMVGMIGWLSRRWYAVQSSFETEARANSWSQFLCIVRMGLSFLSMSLRYKQHVRS